VRTLADMLATNLARTSGLHVVSTARMYELADGGAADLDLRTAARLAGATRLLEGSLRVGTRNRVRLVLRTIDVADGDVLGSVSVEGSDLFELADAATIRLVAELGLPAPPGSIVDVTTRSEVAYRLYDEGLRAFFRGDHRGAYRLFSAALAEDSTFAMAAFYVARLSPGGRAAILTALDRALALSDRVSEREGLIMRAFRAWSTQDPALFAIADSLAVRYPAELEGPLYVGRALQNQADFGGALRHYRRVVTMDSAGFQGHRANCTACEAQNDIISSLLSMDSTEAAEREAINWTRFQPQSTAAWNRLREARTRAANRALLANTSARMLALDPTFAVRGDFIAYEHLPFAQFTSADSAFRALIASHADEETTEARWYLTLSLRMQGRLREALAVARRNRSMAVATEFYLMHEAQVLLEMGRFEASAALFDTAAAWPMPVEPESYTARHRTWALAHRSNALAGAGDTVRLKLLIDSIQKIGARSSLARDQRMHHHARGLLLAARGEYDQAAHELTRAAYSPVGYTRTNYELARTLLALNRPLDAVPPLQQGLRAGLEGGALYLTTTELHELLARAWDSAGVADSARVHYRAVADNWRNADPVLRTRVQAAQARLRALAR
jgi:tetratricopeptide (TPR) repeat protein